VAWLPEFVGKLFLWLVPAPKQGGRAWFYPYSDKPVMTGRGTGLD
jgi:hypothetical protein